MTDKKLIDPPAQQILNDQGYLVMRSPREYPIPHVLEHLAGGSGHAVIPGPIVIFATATVEEWCRQGERYDRTGPPRVNRYDYYYKVIAE